MQFKVRLPKRHIDPKRVRREIEVTIDRGAKQASELFSMTHSNWGSSGYTKPSIYAESSWNGNSYEVLVGRRGLVYAWVSRGTKPHTITATNPTGLLRFPAEYNTKTMPGILGPTGDGSYRGAMVERESVQHPGIAPRKFDELVLEEFKSSKLPTLRAKAKYNMGRAILK